MKTLRRNFILLVLLTGGVFAFSECAKESVNDGGLSQPDAKALSQDVASLNDTVVCTGNGNNNGNPGSDYLFSCITSLPSEPLSNAEIEALNTMREEEMLAHDVYVLFFSLYKVPVFSNISKAETKHTDAISTLLLKYSLTDPALNHVEGVFGNTELQTLYTNLVEQGKVSLTSALTAGATIEDLDINDLHKHINTDIDNQDILFVFGNLEKGSRNHLRAFNRLLTAKSITYTPKYISVEYFNQIISSPQETGSAACPN